MPGERRESSCVWVKGDNCLLVKPKGSKGGDLEDSSVEDATKHQFSFHKAYFAEHRGTNPDPDEDWQTPAPATQENIYQDLGAGDLTYIT